MVLELPEGAGFRFACPMISWNRWIKLRGYVDDKHTQKFLGDFDASKSLGKFLGTGGIFVDAKNNCQTIAKVPNAKGLTFSRLHLKPYDQLKGAGWV